MNKLLAKFEFCKSLLSIHSFLQTIFFNFYYLPFKQAIYLPIWVYKPHFIKLKGKVIIDAPKIKPGMIRLGFWGGHMFPNNGFYWMHEGSMVFKGGCVIGNNSYIITGKTGKIEIGDNFIASSTLRLISYVSITFGYYTRIGWDTVIMDTNFHPLWDMEKERFKRAYGPIEIGRNNWFGAGCMVMFGVVTPKRCVFGAKSILTRGVAYEPYCVHGGSPMKVLSRNVKRIEGQDYIYEYK